MTPEQKERVERFIAALGPKMRPLSERPWEAMNAHAAYNPGNDTIMVSGKICQSCGMPHGDDADYNSLLHELAHWSGAIGRMSRRTLYTRRGQKLPKDPELNPVAREEAIAYTAGMMLTKYFGFDTPELYHDAEEGYRLYGWRDSAHVKAAGIFEEAKEAAEWLLRAARKRGWS